MKTLLVGVDFTKTSDNTINYAIQIAKQSGSKLLLFHALTAPVIHTTSGLIFLDNDKAKKMAEKEMKDLINRLSKEHKGVKFDMEVTYDGIKDRVKKLAKNKKINLVVLGLETKTKIETFINRTTSLDLTGKIDCPIITVSEKYKKHNFKKMIVAIDNKETLKPGLSKRIHSLIDLLKMEAEFVHVITDDELQIKQTHNRQIKVTNINAADVKTGLSAYARKSKADLIMLISNKYGAFYSLFVDSHSKKMIMSSNIPVISVHK
jgi:nucleotide-binding universal stress UspA family protein